MLPDTDAPPAPPPPARRRRLRRVVIASALAVTLVAGGTSAWALNRFVIDHVEISDVAAYEASVAAAVGTTTAAGTSADSTGTADDTGLAPVVTDTSYVSDDSNITISTVVTGSGDSTVTYYVADVVLDDATELRSAFADNSFGENIVENTSDIAADNNAIFAINGDYYGFRDSGIVIRNGVIFRDDGAREGLAFYRDGTVQLYDETTTTATDLLAAGVWNTLSFGPALLENGEILSGIDNVEVDTNFGNHSIQGEQPRTAVGIIAPDHLVFVVVDGRSPGYSAGVTMTGLAQIMQGLGATTAYNLDGGGSSTMYFNGELVNNPLGRGEERGTSDILYVGA
jgi:exopolysaccharide biosynthesis protein